MTCREKLKIEYPEHVNDTYEGGCFGCPNDYGYHTHACDSRRLSCEHCWDRVIPGTEKLKGETEMKKTKQDLLDEIKNLKEQIERIENKSKYDKGAMEIKALFDSYVDVGFSEERAFELVLTSMNSAMK